MDLCNLGFSVRQEQIVALAIKGMTDKEIAKALDIGVGSVKTHWERMRFRLQVHNRVEVIAHAMSNVGEPTTTSSSSEQLLEQVFAGAGVGLGLLDEQARFTQANLAFAKLFGFESVDELDGVSLADVVPDLLRMRTVRMFYEVWHGPLPITKEWSLPTKKGGIVQVRARISKVTSPSGEMMLVAVDDVSESLFLKQQVKMAAEQAAMIAGELPLFVWLARPDGFVEYCNPWFQTFSGAGTDVTYGTGCANVIHPDDLPASKYRWTLAKERTMPYSAQGRFRSVDGNYRWHEIRMLPTKTPSGEVASWVGCAFDVHSHRVLEHEYEKLFSSFAKRTTLDRSLVDEAV